MLAQMRAGAGWLVTATLGDFAAGSATSGRERARGPMDRLGVQQRLVHLGGGSVRLRAECRFQARGSLVASASGFARGA